MATSPWAGRQTSSTTRWAARWGGHPRWVRRCARLRAAPLLPAGHVWAKLRCASRRVSSSLCRTPARCADKDKPAASRGGGRGARPQQQEDNSAAQQRFGNAKSISSAAFFNADSKETDYEKNSKLAQFQARGSCGQRQARSRRLAGAASPGRAAASLTLGFSRPPCRWCRGRAPSPQTPTLGASRAAAANRRTCRPRSWSRRSASAPSRCEPGQHSAGHGGVAHVISVARLLTLPSALPLPPAGPVAAEELRQPGQLQAVEDGAGLHA